MIKTYSTTTLIDTLWPSFKQTVLIRNTMLVLAGTALIAWSAKIQVPMIPVPMTLQTLAVLFIGMAFGWRLGGVTLVAYLAEGALGLPVFAKGGGIAYFTGPTAGYLFGFLAAAVLVGWLAERGWDRSYVKTFAGMLIGTAVIFAFGVLWLAAFIGLSKAVDVGLLPFLMGGIVKAGLATAILPVAWKFLQNRW